MQIVVAEHGLHAAFVLLDPAQRSQRLRAAVDQVAGEPQGVGTGVEADVRQQGLKFGKAALDVANCVMSHTESIGDGEGSFGCAENLFSGSLLLIF